MTQVAKQIEAMKNWPKNEPVFVLRGQDILAGNIVDMWADEAESVGVDPDKVQEARNQAHTMKLWPHHKVPD